MIDYSPYLVYECIGKIFLTEKDDDRHEIYAFS